MAGSGPTTQGLGALGFGIRSWHSGGYTTAAESLGAEKLRPRGLDSLEIVRIGSEGEAS